VNLAKCHHAVQMSANSVAEATTAAATGIIASTVSAMVIGLGIVVSPRLRQKTGE
jgi:hypothetical protein